MDEKKAKAVLQPGEKIGRWTLLSEQADGRWLCRCDCGTERAVLSRSLRYGGSLSCGCQRKGRGNDLTGKTFGQLTVLGSVETPKKNGRHWRCKCACGEEYVVQGTLLVTGRRTRCPGRAHEKNYAYSDITGQKFGRLTARYPSKRYDKCGSVIWHCQCDCGKEVDVPYNSLMYANQKSCGCQKKEHDQKLTTYLTHVAGTSIDMLKSKKVPTDNTSGYRGVYLIRGKYVAKIVFQKKAYYLGTYGNIWEAAQARREAEELLFDGVAEHYSQWKSRADRDPLWAEANPVQVTVTQDRDRGLLVTFLPLMSERDSRV